MIVFTRKEAFRTAWALFRMATGSRRVGFEIEGETIILSGNDLIKDHKKEI